MAGTSTVRGVEMARPITIIEPPSPWRLNPLAELARLPRFFDLLWTLSVHRLKVRYKQSRLGFAWAMLQPLAMMLVFTLMFSFIGGAPAQGVPYALFAYSALLPWSAFSSGLSSAAGALTGHAGLLTKVYFPREILPLTYVVVALVDFGIASLVLAGLMAWYGVVPGPAAAWSLVALGVLTAFLVAAGLLLSALQVRYRDVGLAMPVLLQVWLFATPVLYPLDAVKQALNPFFYSIYILNPLAGIIEAFRRSLVLNRTPDGPALGAAAIVTAVLLPAAYTYFKFRERTMADLV